ncbi:reverse transcriptase domain-containing protein [Tanacetum coccineum]
MNPNNQGPPPMGPIPPPIPQNYSPPGHNLENPAPDLRTMEEICQPTMNGRGGPIAPINIQSMDFGLKNHMIQHVQNSCQFHGLPSDDANKHLDKFLTITQSMKQNGVTDDALRLCLFPYSLTHHATAWFDHILKNYIHTFKEMVSKFLSKYFPPSMITKVRNDISNFRQLPDESLFEAWERYKLLIDRCPNHNMLPVTQIDTFYNRLTLRHRDTINAAAEVVCNRQRNRGDPSLLLDFEEINMNPNNQGPPLVVPIPQNHGPPGPNLENQAPDLRTMEELCQPTMNGRGGPIAPVNIQATDFGLKNHMIQQSMKQNGVTDDALRLYLFPYSLTHHATAWFDHLSKNSIHTFEEMVAKFLSKYFPPSMVTKLRNDISNFQQLHDESLFEA